MTPRVAARAMIIETGGSLLPCSYMAMVLVLRPRALARADWLRPMLRRRCAIRSPIVFLHFSFFTKYHKCGAKAVEVVPQMGDVRKAILICYGHLCVKQRRPLFSYCRVIVLMPYYPRIHFFPYRFLHQAGLCSHFDCPILRTSQSSSDKSNTCFKATICRLAQSIYISRRRICFE